MTDAISQFGILVLGLLALFLVARKNKWGFVFGLLTQPFWFATAYQHEQWGIFALNFGYLFTWSYGIWHWFVAIPKSIEKKKGVLEDKGIDHHLLIQNMMDSKPFKLQLVGSFSASEVVEALFALGAVYEYVGGQELRFHFDQNIILVKPHDHPEW